MQPLKIEPTAAEVHEQVVRANQREQVMRSIPAMRFSGGRRMMRMFMVTVAQAPIAYAASRPAPDTGPMR